MSAHSTTLSICNTLAQQFDPITSTIRNFKSSYRDKVAEFSAELRAKRNLILDPQDVLQHVTDLQEQAQSVLPGSELEDMEELRRFISACTYFGDANPVGMLFGGTLGVFDKIDQFIDDLADTVPQIGLGKLADAINNVLSGITIPRGNSISALLAELDKIFNCVCTLCPHAVGEEYYNWCSTAVHTIDNLYEDFGVINDPIDPNYGKFNFPAVYSDAGLNPTQIESMDVLTNGIGGIKSNAVSQITNAANAAKSLIKSGGFF